MDDIGLRLVADRILKNLTRARNRYPGPESERCLEDAYQGYRLLYDEFVTILDDYIRVRVRDSSKSEAPNPEAPPATDEPN